MGDISMIKRKEQFQTEIYDKCCGGEGRTAVTDLLKSGDLYAGAKLIAHARMEPGDSIGWHVHEGEMEAYIVLNGEGVFNDNGAEHRVYPMDVTLTYSGEGHAIRPGDDHTLEILAVILSK